MLGETIFSATQRSNVATIRNNVATTLQCSFTLEVVVANRPVKHHLNTVERRGKTF